ncbi:ATP-binding protein [uncultured Sphingomonas sp.]|uniref:sensor histidine kinase NtrY-like n=1 Tax=uncultured Sphingomonas sp. TaxID=158754 RepID=UPI0035CBB9AF
MTSVSFAEARPEEHASRLALTPVGRALAVTVIVAIATGSYILISRQSATPSLYNPLLIALMLVANLLAGSALLVLVGRWLARRRAARTVGSGGQLHVRLVLLFSVMAAVPMLLVSIVASLLFQYGVQFWYSDQSRAMLDGAASLARDNYQRTVSHWGETATLAAGDMAEALRRTNLDDPRLLQFFGQQQVYYRGLSDGILFTVSPAGLVRTHLMVNPDGIDVAHELTPARLARLRTRRTTIVTVKRNQITALAALPGFTDTYLFTATDVDMQTVTDQLRRGQAIQDSYRNLLAKGRSIQLRFNAALLLLSLLIVGLAVWIALTVADRLVRPVAELVGAARRVEGGDLTARVPDTRARDEVGTLSRTFNQMTGRLQGQTEALEQRRALIEAVVGGVSAGVVATSADRVISLANAPAARLLASAEPVGRALADVAPELDRLVLENSREAIVEVGQEGETRTLAVRLQRTAAGAILTFDDITQQQLDQRRAAWADVARRIAHEIKNPLTPIQLAAERLQRRYGAKVEAGDVTFARLTETIVRQVGDIRRMVDEFSSFARMPKPMFRDELLVDIVRQTLFLLEVAHPGVRFTLDVPDPAVHLVCDRRLLGQALGNVVKNAVEAIEAKGGEGEVAVTVERQGARMVIAISDTGVGLPADRERIVEPYVTHRPRGTGLGLAIVKKIVEEHHGMMTFSDRPGGGAVVTLAFDVAALATLEIGEDHDDAGEGAVAQLARSRS